MISAKKANKIFLQSLMKDIYPPKDKFIEYLDEEIQKSAQDGCHTIVITERSFDKAVLFHSVNEDYLNDIITPILKENGYNVSYEEYFDGREKHYRFEISWNLLNVV